MLPLEVGRTALGGLALGELDEGSAGRGGRVEITQRAQRVGQVQVIVSEVALEEVIVGMRGSEPYRRLLGQPQLLERTGAVAQPVQRVAQPRPR